MVARLGYSAINIAHVDGDLSFDTVLGLEQQGVQFLRQSLEPCTIDFAGVGYSNSVGVALILAWLREARTLGRTIYFAGLPDDMLALLNLSDLDTIIPVIKS